ncbi:MAG: hypothetical protein U0R52_01635 [Solirubrobacterales bacterium]
MWARIAILLATLAAAGATIALIASAGGSPGGGGRAGAPGAPTVRIVSPRNGSRQTGKAVVVRVEVANFRLSPRHFGGSPLLGEGHIRFALNRVPDCVDPAKLQRALDSPLSSGRLIGRSLDYPEWSGPNGVLAERIGTAGLYSPATEPEIFYQRLPQGFYRLVVTLAENSGAATPYHAVTNFQVLPDPRAPERPAPDCRGKVSSAKAAEEIR